MLQSIRDRTQGWIAGIIISLLILSFALWGIHSYFMSASVNTAVAEVNGVEITKGQLAVAYERLRRQMQSQFGSNADLPMSAETGLKGRALQALVNIQVLKQASLKQNYLISRGQVDSFLENMPEFQINGQFSVSRFQQALSTTMYTPSEFLELIKTSLLIDQPRLGMIFTSFSLPNEVNDAIELVNQERDIQFAILSNQSFANQIITIPQNAINAYYEQHQDEFKTPEQVSIEYIELSVKDLINTLQASDDELKSFYNENSNSFAQPAQWKLDTIVIPLLANATEEEITQAKNKANEVYNKAKEGIDFSALSRHYALKNTTDPKWVTQNQVTTELQKTLLTLTKSGEIANPVRVSNGFVILKAAEFKEPELISFDKVKDKVNEAFLHQQAEEKFINVREKLSNLTYEHPDSLQPASQELGLPIKVSELFTRDKGSKDITTINKIRDMAFSNDVLNLQNNSDVIQKSSDAVVVIRIKSHVPSAQLSLKAVQQQIMDKLKTSAIDAKTLEFTNIIKQSLTNGATFDQIAQQYNLVWNNVGFIPRHSTKVDSAILDSAFGMPKSTTNNKITYSIAKVPNGYAIVALKAVKNGKSSSNDEYDVYAEQIQNTQGLLEYELYKQSMISGAKIINQS